VSLPDVEPGSFLWPHQEKAVRFLQNRQAGMLAMEMGTGKTLAALELLSRWRCDDVLVLCPKSVVPVWPEEVAKHRPMRWRVTCLDQNGSAKRLKRFLADRKIRDRRHRLTVTNYEAILNDRLFAAFKRARFDCAVWDESHRIKAPGGKISRRCSQLCDRVPRRLALTGTPAPHSPLDLYAQFRALDKRVFGTSFAAFRSRYAVMGGFEGREVVAYQNLEELHSRMAEFTFRVRAGEVLALPPQTEVVRYCTLGDRAEAVYGELEADFLVELQEGRLRVPNALAKLLRLQQITSGYLPVEDERGETRVARVGEEKKKLFAEVLEDLRCSTDDEGSAQSPVVVFARFLHDLDDARDVGESLGYRVAELSGRRNDLELWQKCRADLLAVQTRAGSLGIDLTRARYAVFYSLGFSLGDHRQAIARLHRPGQRHSVTFVYLLARGTVDEIILRAVRKRAQVVDYVIDELRERKGGG